MEEAPIKARFKRNGVIQNPRISLESSQAWIPLLTTWNT
jgi:hypothetical protein